VNEGLERIGRKRSWPNFKVLSQGSLGVTEKSHEKLKSHSRSLGRDLNPGPTEYETGVLTT
jgi:hypothetical protein